MRPSSGGNIPRIHFGLTTNTGTGETVLTGGEIHTLLHEINAASEMNGDVYEGVPSGVAWACHEHPEAVADASEIACGGASGFATMHGGGGEHDATVAARGAAARNSGEDGDRRR